MTTTLKPAPIGRRMVAALIDFVVVNLVATLLCLPILHISHFEARVKAASQSFLTSIKNAQEISEDPSIDPDLMSEFQALSSLAIGLTVIVMVVYHTYYIFFESRSGQTPGKEALGLRVVSALDGSPITKRQALIRELLRWYVDAAVVPAAIAMSSTVRRQRVGDIYAKTMVVRASDVID